MLNATHQSAVRTAGDMMLSIAKSELEISDWRLTLSASRMETESNLGLFFFVIENALANEFFICQRHTHVACYYTNIYDAQINSEPQIRVAAIKGWTNKFSVYGEKWSSISQSQFSWKAVPWVGSMNSERPWRIVRQSSERTTCICSNISGDSTRCSCYFRGESVTYSNTTHVVLSALPLLITTMIMSNIPSSAIR